MREILFKAKRKDNGEWVEGDLIKNDNTFFPMVLIGRLVMSREEYMGLLCLDGYELYEVDPETVCQYTGLKDKNGKQIFEGSILRNHLNPVDLSLVCFGEFGVIDVETEEVVDKVVGWYTKVIPTDELSKCKPFCYDMPLTDYYIERCEAEVIGNIHDYPDLLKGGVSE